MSNVVTLRGAKRWKAVITHRADGGTRTSEYFFEEILDLHLIIEHGPDWNMMISCLISLNRPDDGDDQNSASKPLPRERQH